jgi:hypothetical protein
LSEISTPNVVILGMHRSGTSYLTRALNLCGLNLGPISDYYDDEIQPIRGNPKGHWENIEVNQINEMILTANGGSWDIVPDSLNKIPSNIEETISDLLSKFHSSKSLAYGYKDPRFSITLEKWISKLKNVVLVGIFRDPLKVAESLKTRNNFDYEKSISLWQKYNENLEQLLQKHGGFLINFDWPKKKLLEETQLVAKKLGLYPAALETWFSEDFKKSDKTFKTHSLSPKILEIHNRLKEISCKNNHVKINLPSISTTEYKKLIGDLLANSNSMYNEVLTKTSSELDFLRNEHSRYQEEVSRYQEEVSRYQEEVSRYQEVIDQYKAELEFIKTSFGFKFTRFLGSKIDRISKKPNSIRGLNSTISASKKIIKNEGFGPFLYYAKEKIKKGELSVISPDSYESTSDYLTSRMNPSTAYLKQIQKEYTKKYNVSIILKNDTDEINQSLKEKIDSQNGLNEKQIIFIKNDKGHSKSQIKPLTNFSGDYIIYLENNIIPLTEHFIYDLCSKFEESGVGMVISRLIPSSSEMVTTKIDGNQLDQIKICGCFKKEILLKCGLENFDFNIMPIRNEILKHGYKIESTTNSGVIKNI